MRREFGAVRVAMVGMSMIASCGNSNPGTGLPSTSGGAGSSTTFLLKDIELGTGSSSPANFRAFGERLAFTTSRGGTTGLWVTDGTPAGTVPMLNEGRFRDIDAYGPIGPVLFFSAEDAEHGIEPWRTDPTLSGVLVKDINAGPERSEPSRGSSYPRPFADLGGTAVFVACDEEHGPELWRSDGTPEGTALIKDIYPGPGPVAYGSVCLENFKNAPSDLTPMNGLIYFLAEQPDTGRELWRTDGTPDGTRLVRETLPGPDPPLPPLVGGSPPRVNSLTRANDRLFFNAGAALWTSDGTPSGTVPIANTIARLSAPAAHRLYFAGPDGLWLSDGSAQGTTFVKKVKIATSARFDNMISDMQAVGDTLFFVAFVVSDPALVWDFDWELWRSDGTTEGTFRLRDIRPGSQGSAIENLTPVGRFLYFSADDGVSRKLWRTDGTPDGTVPIDVPAEIASEYGQPGQFPRRTWGVVNGLLLFAATDSAHGTELWAHRPPDSR